MIDPASGNGNGSTSGFGAAFSNLISNGIQAAQANAALAIDSEDTIGGVASTPLGANAIGIYGPSGALVGAYANDGTKFSVWSAASDKVVTEVISVPSGGLPIGADGSPVIYNSAGQVVGFDVAAYGPPPTSGESTDSIESATGQNFAKIVYTGNGFAVQTGNGYISGAAWLALNGLSSDITAAEQTGGSVADGDREAIDASLTGLGLEENDASGGSTTTIVFNASGVEVGSFGYKDGAFETGSGSTLQGQVDPAYFESLGLTEAEVVAAGQSAQLSSDPTAQTVSDAKAVNEALTAYVLNSNVEGAAPVYVAALSSTQLEDIWSQMSVADFAYASPDALAEVATSLFSTSNPSANLFAGLGANAVGLTSGQLGVIANNAGLNALGTTAVGVLTSAQLASLSSNQLSTFTSTQLTSLEQTGALTATQVQAAAAVQVANLNTSTLTTAQIAALIPAQLNALTTAQWHSLNVAALSTSQIEAMSTYSALDESTLSALASAGLLQSISNLSSIAPSIIGGLSAGQLAAFTPTQFATLSGSQVSAFTALNVASVNAAQVESIQPGSFYEISNSALSALTSQAVQGITSSQLTLLSTAQWDALNVSALSSTQIAGVADYAALDIPTLSSLIEHGLLPAINNPSTILSSVISGLSATDLAAFSPAQFANLAGNQVAAFTASNVANLDASQVGSIQRSAFSEISDAALSALTPQALAGLTSALTFLSSSQLGGLSAAQWETINASYLSSYQLSELTTTEWDNLTVSSLGSSQLSNVLSYAAIDAPTLSKFLSAGILSSLDNISTLSLATIPQISTAVLQGFSPGQIATLTTTQVATLTPSQVASLSASQLGLIDATGITPAQAAALSATQAAELNAADLSLSAAEALTPGQGTSSVTAYQGTESSGRANPGSDPSQAASNAGSGFAAYDMAGNLVTSSTPGIAAITSSSGAFAGLLGVDPSTGDLAVWDTGGQEWDISQLLQTPEFQQVLNSTLGAAPSANPFFGSSTPAAISDLEAQEPALQNLSGASRKLLTTDLGSDILYDAGVPIDFGDFTPLASTAGKIIGYIGVSPSTGKLSLWNIENGAQTTAVNSANNSNIIGFFGTNSGVPNISLGSIYVATQIIAAQNDPSAFPDAAETDPSNITIDAVTNDAGNVVAYNWLAFSGNAPNGSNVGSDQVGDTVLIDLEADVYDATQLAYTDLPQVLTGAELQQIYAEGSSRRHLDSGYSFYLYTPPTSPPSVIVSPPSTIGVGGGSGGTGGGGSGTGGGGTPSPLPTTLYYNASAAPIESANIDALAQSYLAAQGIDAGTGSNIAAFVANVLGTVQANIVAAADANEAGDTSAPVPDNSFIAQTQKVGKVYQNLSAIAQNPYTTSLLFGGGASLDYLLLQRYVLDRHTITGFQPPASPQALVIESSNTSALQKYFSGQNQLVRVGSSTLNPSGPFWTTLAELENGQGGYLTPAQIQAKFALPALPTSFTLDEITSGTVYITVCGPAFGFSGGGLQIISTGGNITGDLPIQPLSKLPTPGGSRSTGGGNT